jgi:hypothetical protein
MVTSVFDGYPPDMIPNVVKEWSEKFDEVRSKVVFEKKILYILWF